MRKRLKLAQGMGNKMELALRARLPALTIVAGGVGVVSTVDVLMYLYLEFQWYC